MNGRDTLSSKDFLIFVSDSFQVLKAKLIFHNIGAQDHKRGVSIDGRVTGSVTKCPISFKQEKFTVTRRVIDGKYIMKSIRCRKDMHNSRIYCSVKDFPFLARKKPYGLLNIAVTWIISLPIFYRL